MEVLAVHLEPFYQIDITVPYKITGLRGQLLVQSDSSAGNASG